MKRMSYREAVAWISENDEPTEKDESIIAEMISVQLIADLTGKSVVTIATDITAYRVNHKIYRGAK